jgi:hypothetical protein
MSVLTHGVRWVVSGEGRIVETVRSSQTYVELMVVTRLSDGTPKDQAKTLATCAVDIHRQRSPDRGGQRDLPVNTCGLASALRSVARRTVGL